jgi:hypothetical protein
MTDDDKRIYPSGREVSTDALADLLETLSREIRTRRLPVNGLLTEQRMTDGGEPLEAAIRLEYTVTDSEVMPGIELEDDIDE